MAQIIIAKHRKGATGDVLLTFRGEYTRFENPEDSRPGNAAPPMGGEILGSKINGDSQPTMGGGEGFRSFADEDPLPANDNPLPY
jgi:replicative DNA helicase